MRVFISGSNGFVGSRIVEVLKKEASIDIVEIDTKTGYDIMNINSILLLGKCDVFIHLAALSYVPDSFIYPEKYYRLNIIGTLNALEICRIYNAKMIYASSYVYGRPEYLPINENHPLKASNPYAQSKLIGEKLCEGYYRDFNVPCTILRPFNIYGKGQNESFLIPSIVKQITNGQTIIKLKDPLPKRDFVHIDDVTDAFKLCVLKKEQLTGINLKHYNVCSNKSISVYDITEMIKSLSVTPDNLNFIFDLSNVRQNEVNETLGDNSLIKKEVGWFPKVRLEKGLEMLFT